MKNYCNDVQATNWEQNVSSLKARWATRSGVGGTGALKGCFLVLRKDCWFAFVLWCGYCSVSFQSFLLRHLVITPIYNTKKLPFKILWIGTA